MLLKAGSGAETDAFHHSTQATSGSSCHTCRFNSQSTAGRQWYMQWLDAFIAKTRQIMLKYDIVQVPTVGTAWPINSGLQGHVRVR